MIKNHMRFLFVFFVLLSFNLAAFPAAAQEGDSAAAEQTAPETAQAESLAPPPAVAALIKPGTEATYIGELEGYQSWVLAGPDQRQVVYLRSGETTAIAGSMTDAKGENLSLKQLMQAVQDGKLPNIEVSQPATNSGAGDRLLAEVSALRTLSFGDSRGKSLYVFMDPNCPYCKDMDMEIMRQIAAGKAVQLMAIPVPLLGKDSENKALRIYSAPDPTAAWREYIESGKLPELPQDAAVVAAAQDAVDANLKAMKRWKLSMVPFIIWRTNDGRVMINYGTPKDVREFWRSVGIE